MQDQLVSLYLLKEQHPEEKVLEDIKTGRFLIIEILGVTNIYEWLDSFKSQSTNQFQLKFIKQVAAEQEIHSTYYGVKGKIDSTVLFENELKEEEVTAVELKTGKYVSDSHRGQVMIYLIILGEVF